jgi:putative hydrolase of the HAD superfamily
MKPHASIFVAALQLVDVRPEDAVMVGDSLQQDVLGALRVGMRAILLQRDSAPVPRLEELDVRGVRVIRSLAELPSILCHEDGGS